MVKNLQLIKVKLELKGTSEEFFLTITELIIRSPKTKKEWEQYFHFRWGVLRKPLGMSKNEGRDGIEQQSFHQMVGQYPRLNDLLVLKYTNPEVVL